MYLFKMGETPNVFRNLFTITNNKYCTRSCGSFYKPFYRTNSSRFTISYRGPNIWNSFSSSCFAKAKSYKDFKVTAKKIILPMTFDETIKHFWMLLSHSYFVLRSERNSFVFTKIYFTERYRSCLSPTNRIPCGTGVRKTSHSVCVSNFLRMFFSKHESILSNICVFEKLSNGVKYVFEQLINRAKYDLKTLCIM